MNYSVFYGDCLETLKALPDGLVQCCVTSPPYFGLRDYGVKGQIGLEKTPEEFITRLVEVFREVRRVLADDGTLWVNIGDSYARVGGGDRNPSKSAKVGNTKRARENKPDRVQRLPEGYKTKDLIGIPWMLAFALRADGWYLRQDIIWHKPNPMPESVTDRCTKAHEYIFMLSKSQKYYIDALAMQETASGKAPGNRNRKYLNESPENRTKSGLLNVPARETRNRRSVWTIATQPYKGAHFATFPPTLIEPCILAGSRPGDVVLDPFGGSGTTAGVALKHNRLAILCELNENSKTLIPDRISDILKTA